MSAYSDLILAHPNLLGYWRCNETSGNLADSKGSSTAVATQLAYSQTSPLTWDATSKAIGTLAANANSGALVPNDAHLKLAATGGSVECWFKRNPASDYGGIIWKTSSWGMVAELQNLGCYSYGDGAMRNTGVDVVDNAWHHLVLTMNPGVASGSVFYIDGSSVLTTQITPASDSTSGWCLGNQYNGSVFEGPGNNFLSEVAIYGSQLTPSVVTEHYTMGVNGPPPSSSRINTQFQLRPY